MEIFKLHNDVIHDYQSYIKSFANIVKPVVPMHIMGVYVLLPEANT
jgi:hypothetical protein